ncbi:MAG: metalloregulator ArsR/SmtB family transcription factor [Actinomycetes bacterium]|jgi:DNA-binding transcriptional ArsR family regulator|nr:MAG: transcriptional regulator [Actinomycetota bacterium]
MVVDQRFGLTDEEVDRIFHALADATRRDILRRSLEAPLSVSELAAFYDMSFAAVQKHVAVLEGAGLVTKEPDGRKRLVHGNPETLAKAQALMEEYEAIWRSRVERLEALLSEDR